MENEDGTRIKPQYDSVDHGVGAANGQDQLVATYDEDGFRLRLPINALKRRTGIEHNNAICRHAMCLSLVNPSVPPDDTSGFGGGRGGVDWRTLPYGQDAPYYNLLVVRLLVEGRRMTQESVRQIFV